MSFVKGTGDQEILAFRSLLVRLLGHEKFQPEVTGDLSDLLNTLERGTELLKGLMEPTHKEKAAELLLQLEILIEDDLPMIFRDLLPTLREIRKEAYSSSAADH